MHTTTTTQAAGGVSLGGLLVLAAIAYGVISALGFAPGPLALWRAIRHLTPDTRHPTTSRSDVHDATEGGVVSDVGSAKVIPLHAIRELVRQSDEVTQMGSGAAREDPPPVSRGERRDWVAARLRPDDALGLTPTEIDAKGAALFDCSEKTIERDRGKLTGRATRGTRP